MTSMPKFRWIDLVAQDVLILLGDADHLVAPAERQDLREAGIEPHPLEDDVEGDEVAQERLVGLRRAGLEIGIVEMLGVLQRPGRLVGDRRHLAIHVEQLALVEPEAFDDVLEGVGVDRFLERLAQQILPAFGIGEMAVDRQHDVVGDQRFGAAKKPRLRLIVRRSSSVSPSFDFHSAISACIETSVGIQ